MGARGPQPQPRALRILKGNPSHRPLPVEPVGRAVLPDRPAGLSARAKAVWLGLGQKLVSLGVLTEVDGIQFADLCEMQATLEAVRRERQKRRQFTSTTESGYEQTDALLTLEVKLVKELRALRQTFGLAASYRVNLGTKPEKPDDDDADIDG